ncbi:Fc.00g074270.m01.CDS01 [Cosmosporella sp. VM-42]
MPSSQRNHDTTDPAIEPETVPSPVQLVKGFESTLSGVNEKSTINIDGKLQEPADETGSGHEKLPLYTLTNADGEEEVVPEDDARIRDIPPYVRRIVSFQDDPNLPTLTFRYFLLTILFVAPGAFLSQMSHYRTTYAPYSVFFVQIATNYVGVWLAKILPAWEIRIPFTKWSFNLNPGPFSTKEHVLVTLSAASGANYNLGYTPISMSELYFGQPVNGAVAVFFMLAITWTGYSYAALARQFLIYDPQYPWFTALCQTALFETQRKQRENPTRLSRKQMTVFFSVLAFITLVAIPTRVCVPLSGFAGLPLLGCPSKQNGQLHWWWIWWNGLPQSILGLVIMFASFVFNCWVLIPAAKFGGLGKWDDGLMSNRVFLKNGTQYPLTDLLTADLRLNETAYQEYGQIYVGAQFLWGMFFDYASYTSALVWMLLFGLPQIKSSFFKFMARQRDKTAGKITEQYSDQLNVLQRSYDEIPFRWFLTLFIISFVTLVAIIGKGLMFIPIWTYFVAIATGALVVVPLGWLYALSNFQLPIGTTNELLYGLMVNAVSGFKNPCGASTYGAIAGDAWYRAQYNLQDMKIGHYMHVPPKTVFFSQIFGSLIGIPINYAVVRWVLDTKSEYLSGAVDDPTHQWTGQSLASYLTTGVQYVLVGPARLFKEDIYRAVPYGFLVGAIAPVIMYGLHRAFPRAKFNLWNTTIFFSGLSNFYGNISTGYTSSFIGGFVVMFWAYRYRYELWARWNYILAAAFDAGFNFNMLLIFLCFGAGKVIEMPHWWGNNEKSSERCFALDS